jgi:hypothetical protein
VFLGGAVVLCALWLALRPPLPPPDTVAIASGPPRPARAARSSVKLDAATLERYVGKYEGRQDFTVELTLKNGRLLVESPGLTVPFEMLATSETEFFLSAGGIDPGVDIKFRVANGVVKGFGANTEFGVMYLERVR